MTTTPLRLIPPGVPYILDAEDACVLLSDALREVPGSRSVGGYWDAPGRERVLIRERRLTPQERYGLARQVKTEVAAFDESIWK
jgi:hypothetical protein